MQAAKDHHTVFMSHTPTSNIHGICSNIWHRLLLGALMFGKVSEAARSAPAQDNSNHSCGAVPKQLGPQIAWSQPRSSLVPKSHGGKNFSCDSQIEGDAFHQHSASARFQQITAHSGAKLSFCLFFNLLWWELPASLSICKWIL